MAHISIYDWEREIHTPIDIRLSPTIFKKAQTFKLLPFIYRNTIAIHIFNIKVVLTYFQPCVSMYAKFINKACVPFVDEFWYTLGTHGQVYLRFTMDKYINRSSSSCNFTTLLISPHTTLTFSFVIFQYQTRSYSCMVMGTLSKINR